MISKSQKALIHVAKCKTGMTDDEYRAMLSGFGVASSVELDHTTFDQVMRHFKKMGFKARRAGRSPNTGEAPAVPSAQKLKKKIQHMATDMHLTRTYLDAISKRMFSVDTWSWLDVEQLRKLVAALMYHQKRHGATAHPGKGAK